MNDRVPLSWRIAALKDRLTWSNVRWSAEMRASRVFVCPWRGHRYKLQSHGMCVRCGKVGPARQQDTPN